jgi:hypothetical protein
MRRPLTYRDVRELIDHLGEVKSVKEVAEIRGMKPSRLYGILRRIRQKRALWRYQENYYLAKQRTNPYLKRLLEPKQRDLINAAYTLRTGEFRNW